MKQVIPKNIKTPKNKKDKTKYKIYHRGSPHHKNNGKKYGTSKLERDFARDFLNKMGLTYIYQYEAKDIKRFYDFALTCYDDINYEYEEKDGIRCVRQDGQYFPVDLIIEIDGSYHHSDPRIVTEDKITPMHKHNKFVDEIKNKWCGMHCIPLLRIWEYDIRNNPKMVMSEIKKYVKCSKKKKKIIENRRKPH